MLKTSQFFLKTKFKLVHSDFKSILSILDNSKNQSETYFIDIRQQ